MEFLPRTLVFYIFSHAYLFLCVFRLFRKKWPALALSPAFVAMGLFPYVYHLLPVGEARSFFAGAGELWLPVAFFMLIIFAVADAASLVLFLVRKRFPGWALFFFSRKRYFVLLAGLAALLYGYGVYEAHTLQVRTFTIVADALPPERERIRLVFASDIHIGPQSGKGMLQDCVNAILAQQPDAILLGGDIFDDAFQGTPEAVAELSRLTAPLGVYGVLGNHDSFGGYEHAEKSVQAAGIHLLSNSFVDAGPLRIVGVDDPDVTAQKNDQTVLHLPDLPDQPGQTDSPDLPGRLLPLQSAPEEALRRLLKEKTGRFTVLLDHRPGIRKDLVGLFDLQLSGHSHGGQIIFLQSLLESAYGTPTGMSQHSGPNGGSTLFVTTGTGFSKLPIRLFVPPEIVVLDIVRK